MGGKEYHLKGRERARMRVRIRDAFSCRKCGTQRTLKYVAEHKGLKLHDVHHLDGECGKNSRGYDSVADLTKLITLCHKCHYSHHQFSKKLAQHHAQRTAYQGILSARDIEMKDFRSKGLTLQEIGNKYSISRERVRQILLKV